MPATNASLNGLSALFLLIGYFYIRKQNIVAHRRCMLLAFGTSVLFLVSYLTYHFGIAYYLKKGPTRFLDPAWFRPIYLVILLTHTVLATAIVPMVLITLFRGLKERYLLHRKIARWTWPLWMYVSVTGVLIYLLLYQIFPQNNANMTTQKNTKASVPPITRRAFLAGSAAASAVVLGAPAVLAAESPGEFKRKIKLGVVGAGGRGCWIANLFKRHGGYDMHAVADYFQAVADRCGDGLGVDKARRFSGLNAYRKLIESGVEAIALETPPYFFPEHARAAVDAGLHVYMAKPVAVDVPGCREIEASAKKAGEKQKVFLVDYQLPVDPVNLEAVKMINGGEIGKVMALNTHYFAGQFGDPPKTANLADRFQSLIWCNDVVLGGGYHVNACIHGVDAGLWVANQRPIACLGLSRLARPNPHGDSHDIFELLFEFPDGLVMSHRGKHINNLLQFDVVCQVLGQTGHAQICYGGKSFVRGRETPFNGEVQNCYEAGAVRNIAKFYQCVTEGNFANDTVRRAVDGALTTILGREAGLRRTRLTWDDLLRENKRLTVDLSGLKA